MLCLASSDLEDACTGCSIRKRNVDTLLKTTADGVIELPRHVGGAKDKDSIHVVADTLHLYEELSFDSSGGVIFSFASASAQGIDFIDEDDRWLCLSGHFEKLLDELLGLAHPLADQVRRADAEERALALCGARLGQVRLARSWRPVKQNTTPGFACLIE